MLRGGLGSGVGKELETTVALGPTTHPPFLSKQGFVEVLAV